MTIRAQEPARDEQRTREFLQHASAFTTDPTFVLHCSDRLARGDVEFGVRWALTPLREFARELAEEAADLGAWAALADQAADLMDLPPPAREELREVLLAIAHDGAEAHLKITDGLTRLIDTLEPVADGGAG